MNVDTWTQARPTMYRGIKMRSRLEALWAAQWDRDIDRGLIIDWEYEPICFADESGQYLPDFRVTWKSNTVAYVEIKPDNIDPTPWQEMMEIILSSEPDARLILILGSPNDLDSPMFRRFSRGWVEG